MFYNGRTGCMTRVHLDIFVSIMDQPERRSTNHIALGNSQFHSRFGCIADMSELKDILPSCKPCFAKLFHPLSIFNPHDQTCKKCTSWETLDHSLLKFKPPTKFPVEELPPDGKLSPTKLTYDILRDVTHKAHVKVLLSTWTSDVAKVYLRAQGLNGRAIDSIIEHASNCHTYRILEGDKVNNPAAFEAIRAERDINPSQFEPYPYPSLWTRGLDLHSNIEASMHLLSGVTKTVARSIQGWTASRGSKSSFLSYAKDLLDPVQDLQLSWCKCLSYTGGKLAGWVSENYIAMARISPWFYSRLDKLSADPVFVEPSGVCQKRWLKKHNHGWLAARGLDTTGNAETLRDRVAMYMSSPDGIPTVIGPKGGPVSGTLKMIISLYVMISRLMCTNSDEGTIHDVKRSIKIFLSRFHEYDSGLSKRSSEEEVVTEDPTWISSYNFLCLLNLPEIIEKYGPLRNLWEGGYQGEGYLRVMKPNLMNGLRKNWQGNILKKMLCQKSLEMVLETACIVQKGDTSNNEDSQSICTEDESTCLSGSISFSLLKPEELHTYNSVGNLHCKFREGKPLSVVLVSTGEFICILPGERMIEVIRIGFVEKINGLCYHQWQLDITARLLPFDGKTNPICHYCIFLPCLEDNRTGKPSANGIYTLVTSGWENIDHNGMVSRPDIV